MSFPGLERCDHGEYIDRGCLRCEIDRLRAKVVEIQTQADEDVIDARDAAWNLFAGRVDRRRAAKIWPWLAEYEAAEKARGE